MSFDLVYGSSIEESIQQVLRIRRFGTRLLGNPISTSTQLIHALLNSKERLFFAESAPISGWTHLEQRILGGLGVAMEVMAFDDGKWVSPTCHHPPISATLLFCPGPLLARSDCWDYKTIITEDGLDIDVYDRVLEERVLPLLLYVEAHTEGRAVVTIPGLGCGVFAGKFHQHIAALFIQSLYRLLQKNAARLSKIAMVYHFIHDPSHPPEKTEIDVSSTLRLLCWSNGPALLANPSSFAPDLENVQLYKFVAWDHFSWPGNDFFYNSRQTDDGVSAAATSSMANLLPQNTNWTYKYDRDSNRYLPYSNGRLYQWKEVQPSVKLKPQRILCLR